MQIFCGVIAIAPKLFDSFHHFSGRAGSRTARPDRPIFFRHLQRALGRFPKSAPASIGPTRPTPATADPHREGRRCGLHSQPITRERRSSAS